MSESPPTETITRWDFNDGDGTGGAYMEKHEDGDYVEWRHFRALQSEVELLRSPGEPSVIHPVARICTAYESGFGRGISGRDLSQPYKIDTDEAKAYAIGFTEGFARRFERMRDDAEQPAASSGEPSEKPARRWVNAGSLNNGKCPWMVVPSGACCCLHEAHVGEHQLDHQWAHLAPSPETKGVVHE